MRRVVMQASMSLDGYIADPNDNVGPLFDWYGTPTSRRVLGHPTPPGVVPGSVVRVATRSAPLRACWFAPAAAAPPPQRRAPRRDRR